jgi:hypothetical protein
VVEVASAAPATADTTGTGTPATGTPATGTPATGTLAAEGDAKRAAGENGDAPPAKVAKASDGLVLRGAPDATQPKPEVSR